MLQTGKKNVTEVEKKTCNREEMKGEKVICVREKILYGKKKRVLSDLQRNLSSGDVLWLLYNDEMRMKRKEQSGHDD